jgi:hypothetical protein
VNPPELILLAGEWQDYVDAIYQRYLNDLVRNPKTLFGRPVRARYNPATNGKHFNFWHVISEGASEDDRQIDVRRCERIGWIAWMLERTGAGDPRIRVWNNTRAVRRGTALRRLLWCAESEYIVILDEREHEFYLTTAYPVRGRRAEKLLIEWEASQE